MNRWWRTLRADLTSRPARYWLAAIFTSVAAVAVAATVGIEAVVIWLTGIVVWLIADRAEQVDRIDQGIDDADKALRAVDNLTADREGEPSTGRHAARPLSAPLSAEQGHAGTRTTPAPIGTARRTT